MSDIVYLDGELVDAAVAAVNVSSPGLLHGVGLFETLRAYGGRPVWLEQHVERLQRSAEHFKMPVRDVIPLIPEGARAVLDANELSKARLRFTVLPSAGERPPTLLVTAQPVAGYAPELYETGATVYVCTDYRQSAQDPLAGHKTTSYFPRLVALRQAQEKRCVDALWFTPANLLAEGSLSNVFLVRDGRLQTPPLDTPVLPGVTRSVVIELARGRNIPVDETPSDIHGLLDANEVFLTNAIMEVMPVTHVEQRPVGDGEVGPITRQLAEAYRELARS